jgi:hypothetical protein
VLGIAVVPADVGADVLLGGKLEIVAVGVEVVGADVLGDTLGFAIVAMIGLGVLH